MSSKRPPFVAIFSHYYPPATRAGGPTRSVSAIVELLADRTPIEVVASSRDVQGLPFTRDPDDRPDVPVVRVRGWLEAVSESVAQLRRGPAVIYANSILDLKFTLLPLVLAKLMRCRARVVIAPRGEFSEGALAIDPHRKSLYLALLRRSRLVRSVLWHASSQTEADDIRRAMGTAARCEVAPPLRADLSSPPEHAAPRRCVKIGFVSRIAPKKNVAFLLEVLGHLGPEFSIHVAGPIEDPEYWASLLESADCDGVGHRFVYDGALEPEEVVPYLAACDLFVFPTRGENFGHVVLEALWAGTPAIVADTAPWSFLEERGAGWTIAADSAVAWAAQISNFGSTPTADRLRMQAAARSLAQELVASPETLEATRRLLDPFRED